MAGTIIIHKTLLPKTLLLKLNRKQLYKN